MIEDSFFGTELHRTLKTSGGDCPFPTVGNMSEGVALLQAPELLLTFKCDWVGFRFAFM